MTNFIPIFPLGIVVYPDEQLNLHIFEPRYKQLIKECIAENKPFGIPTVIDKRVAEYGTLVEIVRVEKTYDNGELDVVTRGIKVFRVLEVIKSIPDKLFAGAIVTYPGNTTTGNSRVHAQVLHAMRELHHILQISKQFTKTDEDLQSYDIAHHVGLSLAEEYELLYLFQELQRLEYLKRHLLKVIPLMAEMERLKDRVKLNGHFRNLTTGEA
ncbi:LON peptidase substrate-binding domain-containing protein [Chitinophaga rhizophila]|uniref:LON peptidase substrate-binding domain-containing protein n=1 Tax=Chitinophaga rhizophila TaxID=2866212 RepID=A0ABS7GDX0_9BACT|nr:LON peptidase substrate-binding domain-containing protein [Chitinophaga rhizophila]MBW8685872.1 LON peptidase substrate-binding domain-containing protein [Chitinophaga rhizophila]